MSQKREWFCIKFFLVNHICLDVPEISYPTKDDCVGQKGDFRSVYSLHMAFIGSCSLQQTSEVDRAVYSFLEKEAGAQEGLVTCLASHISASDKTKAVS